MNSLSSTIVSVTLIGAGVLAELNLLRVLMRDRRAGPRQERSRGASCAGAASFPARRAESSRPALVAASILTGVVPGAALAQECPSSLDPGAGASLPDGRGPLDLEGRTAFSLQPPAAPAIPTPPAPLVISTDRPSFSDSTGIAPVGHLQLETGYTFTFRNRDGVETQRHNGPEVLARVGVIDDRFELRLITSGYTWSRTDDGSGAGFDSVAGWNDITLGVKVKLLDQEGWVPRLALGAQTTLGVGSDSVSNQIAEPTFKLIWSYDLGQSFGEGWKGFTVGGNANVAWPTSSGDRFTQGQGSVYLAFPVADRLSGFAEYYLIGPNSKGTDAAHYIDFGGAYLLTDRVQLDGRFGFGLNEEADNLFVGFGISFLF